VHAGRWHEGLVSTRTLSPTLGQAADVGPLAESPRSGVGESASFGETRFLSAMSSLCDPQWVAPVVLSPSAPRTAQRSAKCPLSTEGLLALTFAQNFPLAVAILVRFIPRADAREACVGGGFAKGQGARRGDGSQRIATANPEGAARVSAPMRGPFADSGQGSRRGSSRPLAQSLKSPVGESASSARFAFCRHDECFVRPTVGRACRLGPAAAQRSASVRSQRRVCWRPPSPKLSRTLWRYSFASFPALTGSVSSRAFRWALGGGRRVRTLPSRQPLAQKPEAFARRKGVVQRDCFLSAMSSLCDPQWVALVVLSPAHSRAGQNVRSRSLPSAKARRSARLVFSRLDEFFVRPTVGRACRALACALARWAKCPFQKPPVGEGASFSETGFQSAP
jgi:hypothetical protein